jgi:hypothetical protein
MGDGDANDPRLGGPLPHCVSAIDPTNRSAARHRRSHRFALSIGEQNTFSECLFARIATALCVSVAAAVQSSA